MQLQFAVYDTEQDCYGNLSTYQAQAGWYSNDTNVATVSGGMVTAVGAGETYIRARRRVTEYLSGGGCGGSYRADMADAPDLSESSVAGRVFDPQSPPPCDPYGCTALWHDRDDSAPIGVTKVIIKRDGQVITNTTRDVIVGQQINLTAEVQSGNRTPTNPQWSVPGTRIANYTANNSTGTVTSLTNLSNTSLSFYWVDGGDGRQVTYSVTVNGRVYTGRATFNVKRPTVNVTTTTGTVIVGSPFGRLELVYGNIFVPGIKFTRANLTIPTGFTGDTVWVQLANYSMMRQLNNGTNEEFSGTGLDQRFPYSINDPNATVTNDSPGLALTNDYISASANNSFEMWLMFKPSGTTSIYVPLRKVNWSYSGTASRSESGWTLTSSSNTQNPPSVDSTTHPTWTKAINALP